jgi:hypothetical protein
MFIDLTVDDVTEAVSDYLSKKLTVPCDVKVWMDHDESQDMNMFYFHIETIKKEDKKDGSL